MAEIMTTRIEFDGLDINSWELDVGVWSSKEKLRLKCISASYHLCRLYR